MRYTLIFKLPSQTQAEVIRVFNHLQEKYPDDFSNFFRTITADKGSEFLDWEGIEESQYGKEKRTFLYNARRYASYERGTNEQANGFIRR